MPEGDSIHRLARRLDARVKGKKVTGCTFRVAKYATSDLTGYQCESVTATGKHLLMRFTRPTSVGLTLHSHLRMDGAWNVYQPGKYPPTRRKDSIRVDLRFEDTSSLIGFSLPVVDLIETSNEAEVIGHLGPDLLGNFDMSDALHRFGAQPGRPVIQALLDQRNAAGIGNLWAVETCFLRGANPWQPVETVDLVPMLDLARRMMRYSLEVVPGMVTTGNRRRGETHWVYGRFRKPCRRCGTSVAFRKGGSSPHDRETWWCPSCQPNL